MHFLWEHYSNAPGQNLNIWKPLASDLDGPRPFIYGREGREHGVFTRSIRCGRGPPLRDSRGSWRRSALRKYFWRFILSAASLDVDLLLLAPWTTRLFVHFPSRRTPPLPPPGLQIPCFVPEASKAISDNFDDFPPFQRSHQARNFIPTQLIVCFSPSCSSIWRDTYSAGSDRINGHFL